MLKHLQVIDIENGNPSKHMIYNDCKMLFILVRLFQTLFAITIIIHVKKNNNSHFCHILYLYIIC